MASDPCPSLLPSVPPLALSMQASAALPPPKTTCHSPAGLREVRLVCSAAQQVVAVLRDIGMAEQHGCGAVPDGAGRTTGCLGEGGNYIDKAATRSLDIAACTLTVPKGSPCQCSGYRAPHNHTRAQPHHMVLPPLFAPPARTTVTLSPRLHPWIPASPPQSHTWMV
jgi:hypothetical protein